MKKFIDKEKLRVFFAKFVKALPMLVVVSVIVVFAVLTYIAITPAEDAAVKSEGDLRVQSLDIHFSKKLLDDLASTTQPTTVKENGGRDPFSPF